MDDNDKDNRNARPQSSGTLDVWAWVLRASVPAFIVGLGIAGISSSRDDHDQLILIGQDVEHVKIRQSGALLELQQMSGKLREIEREIDRLKYQRDESKK